MTYFNTFEEFLDDRFDDFDEIKDIHEYGMAGGFNGFIYHNELEDIYRQYEDDILESVEDLTTESPFSYIANECESLNEYFSRAVWTAVESWALTKVNERLDDESIFEDDYAMANAY